MKDFLSTLIGREGKKLLVLNFIFCSDDYLLQVNQTYLKHDFYTDILTFDLSDTPGNVQAEIYISADRVRDNAKKHNQTYRRELHRVIFHGCLHLCGYTDKAPQQKSRMRQKEEEYLKLYGL